MWWFVIGIVVYFVDLAWVKWFVDYDYKDSDADEFDALGLGIAAFLGPLSLIVFVIRIRNNRKRKKQDTWL